MENRFSFFRAPVTNTTPQAEWGVAQAYRHITLDHDTMLATHRYRQLLALQREGKADAKQAKRLKATSFAFCTFSGVFRRRNAGQMVEHSGLLCLDFDHVGDAHEVFQLKNQLFRLPEFRSVLCFTSPSGDGVKWVIAIDTAVAPHDVWFEEVAYHVRRRLGITADAACRDVSRCCFLPHDAQCLAAE